MFGSKNNTFKKSKQELAQLREDLQKLLVLKGRSYKDIRSYVVAFDYFCYFPERFDGATIVKDLNDLPNLDLDAMYHDFQYIFEGANRNFIKKFKSDLKYIKNMEKNGKGIRVTRFLLLTLSGIIFVPYSIIKNELFRKI